MNYALTFMCSIIPCVYLGAYEVQNYHNTIFPHYQEVEAATRVAPVQVLGGNGTFIAVHSEVQGDGRNVNGEENNYPIVRISDGYLKGFTMKTITNQSILAFKGIPFAKPPIGPLRFMPPVRNEPWSGIRDAMADSPTCIQADYIKQYAIHGSEDCLYLNVFTKKLPNGKGGKYPVMVFIHGGGWYGPAYLLDAEEGVVLVSINYRLSMFGFLSTGDMVVPGNAGLKDQTFALQWVQENIEMFNGDPNRVTIFGESAGAGSVHLHMLSPISRGFFHSAISQSGCATCFWSISERAAETSRTYASLLNCNGSSAQVVECLRAKDAFTLVAVQLALLKWTTYPVVIFGPVIEPPHPGAFLCEHPESVYARGDVAPVPWISGFNSEEGAINVALLFITNGSIAQLNNNWSKYGPIFLDLHDEAEGKGQAVEIAKDIRQHYLGNELIGPGNKERFREMFEDRYTIACGVKGIQIHARQGHSPVYAYRLSYRGKYSIVGKLGQKAQDWGVSHLDDLIYIFNNTDYYPTLSVEDEEYKVSKIITNLWVNFATYGVPYTPKHLVQDASKDWNKWKPVRQDVGLESPVDFFDINLNPKMIADPFNERIKFWRRLRLND